MEAVELVAGNAEEALLVKSQLESGIYLMQGSLLSAMARC